MNQPYYMTQEVTRCPKCGTYEATIGLWELERAITSTTADDNEIEVEYELCGSCLAELNREADDQS